MNKESFMSPAILQSALDAGALAVSHHSRGSEVVWEEDRRAFEVGLTAALPFLAGACAPIDVEAMLIACVPGGDVVDPQKVADNLRNWFAANAPQPEAPAEQKHTSLESFEAWYKGSGARFWNNWDAAYAGYCAGSRDAVAEVGRCAGRPHQFDHLAEHPAIGEIDEGEDGRFIQLYPNRDLPLGAKVHVAPPMNPTQGIGDKEGGSK
jgi:hypothetical protein